MTMQSSSTDPDEPLDSHGDSMDIPLSSQSAQQSDLNLQNPLLYPHQQQGQQYINQYAPNAFNMAGMAAMLPQLHPPTMIPQQPQQAPNVFPLPHDPQLYNQMPYGPAAASYGHAFTYGEQPFVPPYYPVPSQRQSRHQIPSPMRGNYQQNARNTQQARYSTSAGPLFNQTGAIPMVGPSSRPNTHQTTRNAQFTPSVSSSHSKGPPRKPKQSGHALWVGNLPPASTISELKDYFSREATKDIESLFFISRSNCAFVNYRTEATCLAAMNRFHDSMFKGARVVCRLRRSASETPTSPTIVETPQPGRRTDSSNQPSHAPGTHPTYPSQHQPITTRVPEKYFIIKSLTIQDLDQSVSDELWATQPQNESALAQAYDSADNVYLIFSANKSGEYFGYARMTTQISGEAITLNATATVDDVVDDEHDARSSESAATEHAPRGKIFDDSARGTIFWEAFRSIDDDNNNNEETSKSNKDDTNKKAEKATPNESNAPTNEQQQQQLARQFGVQWISTTRLPFYRTRGLRNPWNANREVKIARDGTEIEPRVGQRLLQLFHPFSAPLGGGLPMMMMPQGGMPYG